MSSTDENKWSSNNSTTKNENDVSQSEQRYWMTCRRIGSRHAWAAPQACGAARARRTGTRHGRGEGRPRRDDRDLAFFDDITSLIRIWSWRSTDAAALAALLYYFYLQHTEFSVSRFTHNQWDFYLIERSRFEREMKWRRKQWDTEGRSGSGSVQNYSVKGTTRRCREPWPPHRFILILSMKKLTSLPTMRANY